MKLFIHYDKKTKVVDLKHTSDCNGKSDCKCGCSDNPEVSPEGFGEVLPDIGKNVKDATAHWKSQPRVEAGSKAGGQWTSSEGSGGESSSTQGSNTPDLSHLIALKTGLKHEQEYLAKAKTERERQIRRVWIAQKEKEISSELKFLGLEHDPTELEHSEMSHEELLAEIKGWDRSSDIKDFENTPGEYVKPPFKRSENSHEILSEIEDYLVEHEGAENTAPIEEVPLEDLETLQTRNNKSKVLGILKSGRETEPALVFRKDGTNYLFDGNHRAHAAKLSGKKYLSARVINLSQNSDISDSFYPESSEPLPTTNWHNNHPPANPPHPAKTPGNHPEVSIIAKYKTGIPNVRHNGISRVFSEKDHPRVPAGSPAGGQFASATAADEESDPLTPGAFRTLPESKKRGKMWP